MKKKKNIIGPIIALILVIAVIVVCVLYGMGKLNLSGGTPKDRVYVEKVSSLNNSYNFAGNTYMGVVETQDTLSVPKASDRDIEKTLVKVGDHVNAGDVLFEYSVSDLNATITQLGYDIQNANMDLKDLEEDLKKAIDDKALIGTDKDPQTDAFGEFGYETLESRRDEADNRIEAIKISIQQKKNNIASLESQVNQSKSKIANSQVKATMTGIIETINDGTSDNSNTNAYIVILSEGAYRIKGKVNEQNVFSVAVDMPVTIRSRVERDKVWNGKITRIDMKPEEENNNNGFFYDGGDQSNKSTKYPFYVELDDANNTDLLLGQHVYIELGEVQQSSVDKSQGVWLNDYYISYDDETGEPYVWVADSRMKLKKQKVTLGQIDETTSQYEITSGLSADDYICYPTNILYEGVKCVTNADDVDYSSPMYNQEPEGDFIPEGDFMPEGVTGEGVMIEDATTTFEGVPIQ